MDGQMSLWEEAPASRSPSPEEERAFAASLVSCSSTSELWQRLGQSGSFGRTCPEYLTRETMLSPSFSRKFRTSGMAVSHGEFLTLNLPEYPCGTVTEELPDGSVLSHSAAGVSFLSDTLEQGGGAATVLFEPESLRGDNPSSKQKREELARAAGRDSGARGSAGFCGYASHTASSIGYQEEQSLTLKGNDWQCQVPDVLQAVALQTGHTACNGSGINTDDVSYTVSTSSDQAVAFAQNTRDEVRLIGGDGSYAGALAASPGAKQQSYVCQSFSGGSGGDTNLGISDECSPTMTASQPVDVLCMADDTQNAAIDDGVSGTLKVGGGTPIVTYSHPTEQTW